MQIIPRPHQIQQTFKGLPLKLQHTPVHQAGTIYRLTLKELDTNDKDAQPTPEQIKKVDDEVERLKQVIPNSSWMSRVPHDGEQLLVTGPLQNELRQLIQNLPLESAIGIYNQLREKRFLDILV
jgi:hypothetical protein